MTEEKKPRGPRSRGNDYRVMILLTRAEEESLKDYCERKNITRAAAMREGLRLLVERG